jgi:aminocarboxymuconate-semialdehyde decarboxylase
MLIDYPFETTRVATNLIFQGVMEKLPDIRFILSHAGGTLPMLAHRISIFDDQTRHRPNYPQGALAYIRRFWFDSALCGHHAPLDALRAFVPPTQILFGTDYPYVSAQIATRQTQGFDAYAGFSAQEREMAERGNALTLFPRLAKG